MKSNLVQNFLDSVATSKSEDVDEVIKCLYRFSKKEPAELTLNQVVFLIEESRKIFSSQPTLLELETPVNTCGDLHGHFTDLVKIFHEIGYPPDCNYLFLGNYIDRGTNQTECLCLLLAYKIKYPENFFLLRGNHETEDVNRIHGFFDECKKKYSVAVWRNFNDLFNYLPLAALVEDKIFCCHGGPSPDLYSFKQILRIRRPLKVPETGLVCHLLWAEPDEDIEQWGESYGGTGITFGKKALNKFLKQHKLDLICRSQLVQDGYEFFADRQLVSIFSASNFAGEFENAAAVMIIDEDLQINFRVFVKLQSNQEIITARQLDEVSENTVIKPFYKSKSIFIKEKPKISTPTPSLLTISKTQLNSADNEKPTTSADK